MKKKLPFIALGAEALLCVILCVALKGENAEAILSFPLAQLGAGLRALSLSGAVGNIAAILFYALICLLPVGLLVCRYLKGRAHWEDVLLPIISASMFYALYLLINPALAGDRYFVTAKPLLNGLVLALLISWAVLYLLHLAFEDRKGVEKCGAILLFSMAAAYVYSVFYCVPAIVVKEIAAVNAANTDHSVLGLSYFAILLRGAAQALPYALNIAAVYLAWLLLRQASDDRYSQQTLARSNRLARFCRTALTVDVLLGAGVYVIQLCLAPGLRSLSVMVHFPLGSMAVALAALLLSRLIGEGKQMKDDNDLFV